MRVLVLTLAFLAALAAPAAARDQVPAETRDLPWSAVIPACEDNMVLLSVSERFARTESTYWNSELTITGYDQIRPIAFRPWGLDYIPRRYCAAKALLSNGQWRNVYYSVRESLGAPGLYRTEWGIEYCVQGLDREWAYQPLCQMAKP